ncbi:hypothetical protein ABZT03_20570 [Streptomyces sp. NPDC005574]|uniref:hypothetical protein n=1 Tax=Streptomyces sp. NPDC005574 TaxID=3156891 RepID=UPI0033BC2552
MRLSTPTSLCLAAAAALLPAAVPASPAHARADPDCAASGEGAFPLVSRIHGGPHSYAAGGGYGTWYLDLTNSTARPCTGIHPVVVLVDRERALKPGQPRLEFYAGAHPHPVRFVATDEAELVGAFDGFSGFTVAPRRTVTVKLRLALTSDAVPNQVTLNAAVVQRHEDDDDGDWVGQSNDYHFGIDSDPALDPTTPSPADSASASAPAPDPRSDAQPRPETTGTATRTPPPTATAPATTTLPSAPATTTLPSAPATRLPFAEELARTGLGPATAAAAATLLLVAGGGALMLARRRR